MQAWLYCLRIACHKPTDNEFIYPATGWALTTKFIVNLSGCQKINNKAMGLALWQRSLAKASGLGLGGKLNPPTQFAAPDKGAQNANS